jgi:hypothetical protein
MGIHFNERLSNRADEFYEYILLSMIFNFRLSWRSRSLVLEAFIKVTINGGVLSLFVPLMAVWHGGSAF